jgi:hypothetical protein
LEINNHTIPYTNIDVIAHYLPQIQPSTQSAYTSTNRPYTPNRYAILTSDSPFLFM